jgi:hypothetical protein
MTAALLLTLPGGSGAGDDGRDTASQRAQAVAFLRAHLIDKTLEGPPTTAKLDNGKVEAVFSSRTTFSNLAETKDGFLFDETTIHKQMNHDLDSDGKRILPGRDVSLVQTSRVEITQRKSTGKLVGFRRVLATTSQRAGTTGHASLVRMTVDKGGLEMVESSLLYEDHYAEKGRYRPGATEARTRFSVTAGKVQGELVYTGFEVDPETLKRTPKSDPPIKWIITEVR